MGYYGSWFLCIRLGLDFADLWVSNFRWRQMSVWHVCFVFWRIVTLHCVLVGQVEAVTLSAAFDVPPVFCSVSVQAELVSTMTSPLRCTVPAWGRREDTGGGWDAGETNLGIQHNWKRLKTAEETGAVGYKTARGKHKFVFFSWNSVRFPSPSALNHIGEFHLVVVRSQQPLFSKRFSAGIFYHFLIFLPNINQAL